MVRRLLVTLPRKVGPPPLAPTAPPSLPPPSLPAPLLSHRLWCGAAPVAFSCPLKSASFLPLTRITSPVTRNTDFRLDGGAGFRFDPVLYWLTLPSLHFLICKTATSSRCGCYIRVLMASFFKITLYWDVTQYMKFTLLN